jgi:hypothetical protein
MTHESAYCLSADDTVHTLTVLCAQRPLERLASLSVKRIEQHWYVEAGYEKRC